MNTQGMEYLNSRLMFGMQPGLMTTRKICEALGSPEKSFKSIHVVGTNGKGSTSYYLAGILKAHGYKAGLYTSPHLVSMQERIRVNDVPISNVDLNRLILKVKDAAEGISVEPTFFEVLTIVAFLYYQEQQIDVAVLEAGMGGRLDSTAVALGDIVVVTSIGLEHTEVLGSTEKAILREKMAVLSAKHQNNGRQLYILGGLSPELMKDAWTYAESRGARCLVPKVRSDIELPNLGEHYSENASLSLWAAKSFMQYEGKSFDEALALECLKTRSWAGRMQKLRDTVGNLRFILDGAHNSHAVKRLAETLEKNFPGKRFHCVFGALKDKDVGEMQALMAPHISHWHITKTDYPRFRELEDLKLLMDAQGLPIASQGVLTREFLDSVVKQAAGEPVLITGSLYMIGASVELLKNDFLELEFFRKLVPSTNEHR